MNILQVFWQILLSHNCRQCLFSTGFVACTGVKSLNVVAILL
uniref:Uncharacterized protein n=1 Tax=Rhizophora mucronata TaxID=61149 RepID=A0A2P2MQL3_RHIMU